MGHRHHYSPDKARTPSQEHWRLNHLVAHLLFTVPVADTILLSQFPMDMYILLLPNFVERVQSAGSNDGLSAAAVQDGESRTAGQQNLCGLCAGSCCADKTVWGWLTDDPELAVFAGALHSLCQWPNFPQRRQRVHCFSSSTWTLKDRRNSLPGPLPCPPPPRRSAGRNLWLSWTMFSSARRPFQVAAKISAASSSL